VHSASAERTHRHGRRVHAHPHHGPHRHLAAPRLSSAVARGEHGGQRHEHEHDHDHDHDHGHSHGLIDESIKRSREGIRAVAMSLAVLGLTAAGQAVVFAASGSVALLADLIHNTGDALTAVPLAAAFALRSERAERFAGLAVVAAIFVSACVAGVEAVSRLIHPNAPGALWALAGAGLLGYAGNRLAARIRLRAGRRLDSAALIADGEHARADAYVSLAVIASALAVAAGAPILDPLIGLAICAVILRITWESWRTVRGHKGG
jgi:divalent metal cation (Fe/Co/Zn/Cd) transporter